MAPSNYPVFEILSVLNEDEKFKNPWGIYSLQPTLSGYEIRVNGSTHKGQVKISYDEIFGKYMIEFNGTLKTKVMKVALKDVAKCIDDFVNYNGDDHDEVIREWLTSTLGENETKL